MISTKGRYAIRFLMDLSEQPEGTAVPLEEIAVRQGISKKYLEAVVKILVQGKLVRGISGKGGGYRLTRRPEEYTVEEVLLLTEGSMASVSCLDREAEACPRQNCCRTLPMWKKYDELVHDFFSGITIDDLIRGNI